MDAIVQLVEEGSQKKGENNKEGEQRITRNWICIQHPSINFSGRFVPDYEFDREKFDRSLLIAGRSGFESWLREATTLVLNTEVNVQLGEFTIKKNFTRPLDEDMKADEDFRTVFRSKITNDVIQCADVRNTTNRRWVRLIGMGYDLKWWNVDTRPVKHGYTNPYSSCSVMWIRNALDSWKDIILPGVELFMSGDDHANANRAVLAGYIPLPPPPPDPKAKDKEPKEPPPEVFGQLKEVVVYRYPTMVHLYNVVEYGRRFYRTLIFSTHPSFTYHDMKMESFTLHGKLVQCCGDPTVKVESTTSLVIGRDISAGNEVGNEVDEEERDSYRTVYFTDFYSFALFVGYNAFCFG